MDEAGLPPKRRYLNLRAILLFILLIGAFAAYARYFSNQRVGGQQVYDNLEVLDARLQNIENSILVHEKRLASLEEHVQKQPAVAASDPAAPLVSGTPPSPAATPADDARISALEKQITALKAAPPAQDSERIYKSIRMLSSLHRLNDKIMAGKPFATELAAFEATAAPDESAGTPLGTLAPYADSGIPTLSTLLVSFDQSVEGLNAAQSVPPVNAGFWERLKYNLLHIVTIRRIDDAQTGNSPDAIVGRAQAHLEHEEIEAAVSDIDSLPENLRGNFSGWLEDAHMVTEIPALVSQLEEQIMLKSFGAQAASAQVNGNAALDAVSGKVSTSSAPAASTAAPDPTLSGSGVSEPASQAAEPKPAD